MIVFEIGMKFFELRQISLGKKNDATSSPRYPSAPGKIDSRGLQPAHSSLKIDFRV